MPQETIDALRERLRLANWALREIKARSIDLVGSDAWWKKMDAALKQSEDPI